MPNQLVTLGREFPHAETEITILRTAWRDSPIDANNPEARVEVLGAAISFDLPDRASCLYWQRDTSAGTGCEAGAN